MPFGHRPRLQRRGRPAGALRPPVSRARCAGDPLRDRLHQRRQPGSLRPPCCASSREVNTFIPALAYTFAHNPTEIDVGHEERHAGESKYSLYRLVRLNFDLVTGFSVVPLQMFSSLGFVVSLLGLVFFGIIAYRRMFLGPEAEGLFTLFAVNFLLLGVALFGIGLLGEYVGRIYQQVRERPRYILQGILEQREESGVRGEEQGRVYTPPLLRKPLPSPLIRADARGRIRLPQRRLPLLVRAAGARDGGRTGGHSRRQPERDHLVRQRRTARGAARFARSQARGSERRGVRRHACARAAPDFLFSFYYRQMLAPRCSRFPPRGALNMHGSLLPKYRGRVPVNWAVITGSARPAPRCTTWSRSRMPATSSPSRPCRSCPTIRRVEVFNKVTVAAELRSTELCPASLAGAHRRMRQDLFRGVLLRRPPSGRRPHRLEPAGARRSTTWCAASPRPTPAPSRVAGRMVRILRTLLAARPPRRASDARRSTAQAGRCYARMRRRRSAARPLPRGGRYNAVRRDLRRAGDTPPVYLTSTELAREPCLRAPDMKEDLHPRRQRLHRPPPVASASSRPPTGRSTAWTCSNERVADLLEHERFHFFEGDITINREWIEYHIRKCDTVLPLVAIATPATYVKEPLRVFELDFEANLPIVRSCVKYGKRILFPSTSEVYGMCRDGEFDPDASELVLGPIDKQRWIYSCSKQLMDRVIWAYGSEGRLDFTLFRPFNWIGAGLDSIHTAKEGSSRVITQFLGHIVRGEDIKLVDGGTQKRAFTYIDDGIDALMKIIENPDGIASGQDLQHRQPAQQLLGARARADDARPGADLSRIPRQRRQVKLVETTSAAYYGKGYQDVQNRVPKIDNTCRDLDWKPQVGMQEALRQIFDAYRGQVAEARGLVD